MLRGVWKKIATGVLGLGLAYGAYLLVEKLDRTEIVTRNWAAKPDMIDVSNDPDYRHLHQFYAAPILTDDGQYYRGFETQECRPVIDKETFRYLGTDCQWIERKTR